MMGIRKSDCHDATVRVEPVGAPVRNMVRDICPVCGNAQSIPYKRVPVTTRALPATADLTTQAPPPVPDKTG